MKGERCDRGQDRRGSCVGDPSGPALSLPPACLQVMCAALKLSAHGP